MGHVGARSDFQSAKNQSKDDGVQKLADGLIKLSRAIENDVADLKREIASVKAQLR